MDRGSARCVGNQLDRLNLRYIDPSRAENLIMRASLWRAETAPRTRHSPKNRRPR
jgi:hypothetical protein